MNVLSLCDGMSGGMSALDYLGIKPTNYFASEIDKYAESVSRFHYPEIIRLGNIYDVNYMGLPPIDLLIAGFPCQAFSFAGKQLNFEDPRGKIFFEVVRLLNELQPRYFLLENVIMKKDVEAKINGLIGIKPVVINSSLLTAQNRKRNYWVGGYKDGKVYQIDISQPEDLGILLKDVIVDNPDDSSFIGENEAKWITNPTRLKKKYTAINPDKALTQTARQYASWNGTYVTGCAQRGRCLVDGKRADNTVASMTGLTEQRLELRNDGKSNCLSTVQKDSLVVSIIQKPLGFNNGDTFTDKSLTLTSNSWQDNNHLSNGIDYRKLLPVECERLQSYPDNYTTYGIDQKYKQVVISNSQRYKMIGNGFTMLVIAHILKSMEMKITKSRHKPAISGFFNASDKYQTKINEVLRAYKMAYEKLHHN